MTTAQKSQQLAAHYLDFYSRAVAILDDDEDAKDAVQEAVVKTLVARGVRDVVGYCSRTTLHECFNTLRRRQRYTRLEDARLLTSYDEDRLMEMVRESKRSLLPVEQRLVELHYEDGLPIVRVAAIMDVSVSTVKRLLAHATEVLKTKIKEQQ